MKKIITILLTTQVIVISCSGNKEKETTSVPAGMHALNLTPYGKPFSIYVPDTTKARLEIIEQSSGELHIKVGSQFAVSVLNGPADLTLKKQDIQMDDVNKMKSTELDEPDGLIWQSAITNPEFHFVRNSKAGSEEFSFEDVRREDGNGFGKDAIETMYNSCKNIVSSNPAKASD